MVGETVHGPAAAQKPLPGGHLFSICTLMFRIPAAVWARQALIVHGRKREFVPEKQAGS